jgi:hypothetical protein
MTEEIEKASRNPLKKFFTAAADHHVEMAKCHGDAMERCEAGSDAATFHKSCMAAHADFATKCAECAKDTGMLASRKADESGFLKMFGDEIVPTGISSILPGDAPREAFGKTEYIRAVPRAGMRPLPMSTDAKIAKILGVDGEE